MNIQGALTKPALAVAALLMSLGAYAVPTVSQGGLDITITTSTSGQTVTFNLLAEFGDDLVASSWIDTTMDAFSIQLGCDGNTCADDILSFSTPATTSANVTGTWTGDLGKVSGNGCSDANELAICYTVLTTGTVDSASETIIEENTAYSWMFDIVFDPTADIASILSGDHSIKFLSLKKVGPGNWVTAGQLSDEGSFTTTPGVPVPEPGSLALLGGGLLALSLRLRKKA